MSVTQATVERLVQDLWGLEEVGVEIHSGDSLFWCYLNGKHRPVHTFSMDRHLWFKLDGERRCLLDFPNQSLTVRHQIVQQLEANKMPFPSGIADAPERQKLIELAREFAAVGDQALDYEAESRTPQ